MTADPVRAIADAVLYEGYILWPYRRSALKNQRRFTFGGVYPAAHSIAHQDDAYAMQTEVLLQAAPNCRVQVTVRFLQVVTRDVASRRDGRLDLVDELIVGGERYLSWEEAVEREIECPPLSIDTLEAGRRLPIAITAGREQEELLDDSGLPVGALIRSWQALRGEIALSASAEGDAWRVTVRVLNATPFEGGSREDALTRTFCSTHTLLRAHGGVFVSLTDPPVEFESASANCSNIGTWPVLVGAPGERATMLSSPIILEDYPRVAPESPGDLFDGGEIDQLLILNILTLTDEEKAEMAASDPRARQILERCEGLTGEQLMALHGAIREFGMAR